MENCNVMFVFVPDACRQMCVSFLYLLVKHSLCNCLVICSLLSLRLFWNIGEFLVKKYFADYRTANAIQLIVAIKGDYSNISNISDEVTNILAKSLKVPLKEFIFNWGKTLERRVSCVC